MRPWYRLNLRLAGMVLRWVAPYTVIGADNVPTGGCIIAANHRSYFDPPLVAVACDQELYFWAKHELFKVPLLGPLIRSLNAIPLSREQLRKSDLQAVVEMLTRGKKLLVFPEGGRGHNASLRPAKRGIASLVLHPRLSTPPPIVPCYINWHPPRRHRMVVFGPPWQLNSIDTRHPEFNSAGVADEVMRRIGDLKLQAECVRP